MAAYSSRIDAAAAPRSAWQVRRLTRERLARIVAVEVLASVPGMGLSVFTKSNELNENASFVYVMCLGLFAVSVRAGMIRFRQWLAPWSRGSH